MLTTNVETKASDYRMTLEISSAQAAAKLVQLAAMKAGMKTPAMKTKEFLAEAAELVRAQLPPSLGIPGVAGPLGSLVKIHFGDPKVHYEMWVRKRMGLVETGLHFEGAANENSRCLQAMLNEYADLVSSLGPEVRAEEWDKSWTRVHRTFEFDSLDEDLLIIVSGSVSRMVRVLEPAVRSIRGTPQST